MAYDQKKEKVPTSPDESPDKVNAYACAILSHGLMYMEFRDSIREGKVMDIGFLDDRNKILFKKAKRKNLC